jgi:hypothetical protein
MKCIVVRTKDGKQGIIRVKDGLAMTLVAEGKATYTSKAKWKANCTFNQKLGRWIPNKS